MKIVAQRPEDQHAIRSKFQSTKKGHRPDGIMVLVWTVVALLALYAVLAFLRACS